MKDQTQQADAVLPRGGGSPLRAATEAAARGMLGGERALLALLESAGRGDPTSELRSVLRIASATASAQHLNEVIELVAEQALVALGAASFSISRWEREQGVLRTLINVGALGPGEERLPCDEIYPLAEYTDVGDLILRGQAYRTAIDDPGSDPKSIELLRRLDKEAELGVPIVYESNMWGELWATASHGRRFSERDTELLQAIAAQVAAAIGRAELFERVSCFAFEDPLTGLANRRQLDTRLRELLLINDEGPRELTLILCDVDGLKRVNDRDGHAAGDDLLRGIAGLLSVTASAYPDALVARMGGDEFCVLLPDQPLQVAGEYATAASRAVARELTGQAALSWGAAGGQGRTVDPSRLLREADAAQYAAKRLGGGRLTLSTDPEAAAQLARLNRDRRDIRSRDPNDLDGLVARTVTLLDSAAPPTGLDALTLVADEFSRTLDCAAWSISLAHPSLSSLRTVRGFESQLDRTSGLRIVNPVDDPPYLLSDYPQTAHALQTEDAFTVDIDASDQDPAEVAVLRELGYQTLLGAAVKTLEGHYLLELYGDHKSRSFDLASAPLRVLSVYCAHITPTPRLNKPRTLARPDAEREPEPGAARLG